uniref:TATA box-binding protein-like 1 n=1 Tax=Anopheles dirus TaxID=7168 RepID=A0A182N145_9DIPT
MAATLLQQKTFMNSLTGGPGGGAPDGTGNVGPAGNGSTGTTALIHHLLPAHHPLQTDHHTATAGTGVANATTTTTASGLLQRGHNTSSGSPFVVLSAGGTNHHHRTEQYRTDRDAFNGCGDDASALDEIFSPLPHPRSTECVWDTLETDPHQQHQQQQQQQQPSHQPTATTNHASTTINHNHQQHQIGPESTDVSMTNSDTAMEAGSPAEAPDDGSEPQQEQPQEQQQEPEPEPEPEIDIVINNVVCSFSVRCHLNLHDIALNGDNVEFRRENGMVTMKLRRPYTTASIWSSGKITCTGATSEDQAKVAARRYSRCLQKLGFNVRLRNFRIVNVLGTCAMPWGIKIVNFSEKYKKDASYEPELHPGVTYKLHSPRATLKIFSTGSITVTAASVAFVQAAIEHIFPLVYEFRKKRTPHEKLELLKQPPAFDPQELGMMAGEEDVHLGAAAADGDEEDVDEVEVVEQQDYEMHDGRQVVGQRPTARCNGNTKAIGQKQ